MRILIGLAFAVILGALAWAGVAMLRGGGKSGSKGGDMMRALAVRIAVSVAAVRLHHRGLVARLDPPDRHPARPLSGS